MSYRFQPDKCLAIIAAYPDMQTTPQLIAWLRDRGIVNIELHRHGDGRMDCGYNFGIRVALESDFNQFIFADKDIWTSGASDPFLKAKGDVVSCQYDTGQDECWDAADSFHTGLWRTKRRVLEAVGIRPFKWKLDELGITAVECLCKGFARRVKAAGFDIAHAGTALHSPRTKSPMPMRMRLSMT